MTTIFSKFIFISYVPLTEVICTGDPAKIKEARLSFPSGHSSFSAYSMIFLIVIFIIIQILAQFI